MGYSLLSLTRGKKVSIPTTEKDEGLPHQHFLLNFARMQDEQLFTFVKQHLTDPFTIIPMSGGGSDRAYFRVKQKENSYILTYGQDQKENSCFLYMSQLLQDTAVPQIIAVSKNKSMYLQSDLGDTSLLKYQIEQPDKGPEMYGKVICALWDFQKKAHQRMDYKRCFSFNHFTPTLVLRDLFYFKHYFLDLLSYDVGQASLLSDFERLSKCFTSSQPMGFCYRDFQGRNVMIQEQKPFFIDYQGGMKGPVVYDLVSLIWQAKAQLPVKLKTSLKNNYFDLIQADIHIDRATLEQSYNYCLLERLLQVLGAYGKLGIFQKKPHFIESIKYGIANLEQIRSAYFLEEFPAIQQVIDYLCSPQTLNEIEQKINA